MRTLSYSGDGFAKLKAAVTDNEDSRPLTPKQAEAVLADLASERQAREEAERERDEQAQTRMDGIALHRAENTANAKRLAAQQETIRSRMEALVRMRISQYPGEVGLRWLLSDLRAEAALKEQG